MLFSEGMPSHVSDAPDRMKEPPMDVPPAPDRHPYADPGSVPVGAWATYRLRDGAITISIVGREEAGTWVEIAGESDPDGISARLVARSGITLRAWYRRPGTGEVYPQPIQPASDSPPRETSPAGQTRRTETVTLSGRTFSCTVVRSSWEDLDGRRSVTEAWWSAEVPPLLEGSEFGGLVRREPVELGGFGSDAQRKVLPPP